MQYFIIGKDCTGSCICDVRYKRGYFRHACAHGAWPVHYIGWCRSREVSAESYYKTQMPRVYRVTADRDYTVPPRSEAIITGKMQGKPIGSLFAIEPKNSLQQDSLLIARTVAGQDQGRTPMRILNPSDSILEIKVGERLAEAEAAQVAEGENVQEPPAANLPEHLKPLFDETCAREHLSEAAQCGLWALLLKHTNLFAKDDNDLGRTDLVVHDINTGDARPICQPPRRVPFALQPELKVNFSSMLEKGVAEPGQSPWASPVVLVRKKGWKYKILRWPSSSQRSCAV